MEVAPISPSPEIPTAWGHMLRAGTTEEDLRFWERWWDRLPATIQAMEMRIQGVGLLPAQEWYFLSEQTGDDRVEARWLGSDPSRFPVVAQCDDSSRIGFDLGNTVRSPYLPLELLREAQP